jgi:3-methyladenine DNA glycosylase AlkD
LCPSAREVLGRLERQGHARIREDMLKRYGIVAPKAYGVPMGAIQRLAKSLGRDHDLALALWSSGWYEARLLAAYVDQLARRLAASEQPAERWVGKDALRDLAKGRGGKAVRR